MPCNLICERFLKNIARWYGRTSTGARSWSGPKDKAYDDRVYDFRVAKRMPGGPHLSEEYRRCSPCDIILLKSKFPNGCPCCGNKANLTISYRKGGRDNHLAKRY